MFITKKHLSRRTFIRGTVGAAVALPFLDAMVPALTAQSRTAAGSPFRFGAIYMPNGVFPTTWHPEQAGFLRCCSIRSRIERTLPGVSSSGGTLSGVCAAVKSSARTTRTGMLRTFRRNTVNCETPPA